MPMEAFIINACSRPLLNLNRDRYRVVIVSYPLWQGASVFTVSTGGPGSLYLVAFSEETEGSEDLFASVSPREQTRNNRPYPTVDIHVVCLCVIIFQRFRRNDSDIGSLSFK